MSNFSLPAYGWAPRADQLKVWNSIISPGFKAGSLCCHRRWGKDEIGLQAMAVKAMERTASYMYVFPEYETIRKNIWEGVNWRTGRTRVDDAFPPEIIAHRDNEAMALKLISGSVIQFGGSNRVDSLVGGGQAGVVVSEAALSKPEFGIFIQPVLEESGGWMLKISTPRGKNHFYKSHLGVEADMKAGLPGYVAAHIPASKTAVFSIAKLFKIKMDLIREHGKTLGEAMFAQEYGCSWEAAVVGAVWGHELTELFMQGRVRPLRLDRRVPVHTSWDLGVGDATVILFWQNVNGEDRLIDGYEANGIGLDHYVQVLKDKRQEFGYLYGVHHGPHDIQQREWARGLSRMDEAKRLGLTFKRTPNTRIKTQISAAAQLLRSVVVNEKSPGAMEAYEHFKAYHYPKANDAGVQSTTPVHDEHSHASSAMMTYAVANAARLNVAVGDGTDPELHPDTDALGGEGKFDPREFDTQGVYAGRWGSKQGRPGAGPAAPARGPFG